MKLFKGEMSLWKQLNSEKLMNGPGGLTDVSTYKGAVGVLVAGLLGYFIFWNGDAMSSNFYAWIKDPYAWFFSVPGTVLTPAMRKHHFYAKFWLWAGIFSAGLGCYSVWLTRRRARKSAQGRLDDLP